MASQHKPNRAPRRSPSVRLIVAVALAWNAVASFALPGAAHASTSYVWTGNGPDRYWTDAQNWDPQGVPGTGDSATIASSVTSPGPEVTDAPSGITLQNLTLGPSTPGNSSSLAGGSISVSGSFTWTGAGTLSADVDVLPGASASISGGENGSAAQVLSGDNMSTGSATGTITIDGTGSISDYLVTGYAARTYIVNKGTLTLNPGATIAAEACCLAPDELVNQGTLVVPASSGGTGTVTLDSEAFQDQGPSQIGTNSVLDLLWAPSSIASGMAVSGGGTLKAENNAMLTLGSTLTLAGGTTFNLAATGLLVGKTTLSGSGTGNLFSWTGGTIQSNLTVASSVATSVTGTDAKSLENTGVTGTGLLTLAGPTSFASSILVSGTLTNKGKFTPQAGADISSGSCCGSPSKFANAGTVNVNVGAGNTFTVDNMLMTNSSTVEVRSGTLTVGGAGYLQTNGKTRLDGGSLNLTTSSGMTLQGGLFGGTGTVTGNVQNGALVDPGGTAPAEGALTITGDYTQTSTGTLRADVKGSSTAGTDYDSLSVGGSATLAGTLNIVTSSSYVPSVNARLALVRASSTSGIFSSVQNVQLPNNYQYWLEYQSNGVYAHNLHALAGIDQSNAPAQAVPDASVAKTPSHVLEAANSSLSLLSSGGSSVGTATLQAFFGANSANGSVIEPRALYDAGSSNHRLIVAAEQHTGTTASTGKSVILLAVSRSTDPSDLSPGSWCVYQMSGIRNAGTSATSWAAAPQIGTGAGALVITSNQMTFASSGSGTFTYAVIRALNASTLENNAAACPALPKVTTFQPSTTRDDQTTINLAPVQPVTPASSFTGATDPVYIVSKVAGSSACIQYVWRVSDVASGTPKIDGASLGCWNAYSNPPSAPQKGTSVRLSTGDDRVAGAMGLGNSISMVSSFACTPSGASTSQACLRIETFNVSGNYGSLSTNSLSETDLSGAAGTYYFEPSIAVNTAGQTMISYEESSANSYMSAAWRLEYTSGGPFNLEYPVAGGICAQTSGTSGIAQTGNYGGAALDPADGKTFWVAGESFTTQGTSCAWHTELTAVGP